MQMSLALTGLNEIVYRTGYTQHYHYNYCQYCIGIGHALPIFTEFTIALVLAVEYPLVITLSDAKAKSGPRQGQGSGGT